MAHRAELVSVFSRSRVDVPMRKSALSLLLLVAACAPSPTHLDDPPLDGDKTWSGVIGPLVATRCGICHKTGDIAPFALETYAEVKAQAVAMKAAVSSKIMPPFPPEQSDESGCPQIDDVRRMSDAERQVLLDWLDAGAPQGTAGVEPTIPSNEPLGPPQMTWQMEEEYNSTAQGPDDYRCFVVNTGLVAEVPIGAVSVVPGDRSVVHHAAVYLISPAVLSQVQALDAADPGPGYSCFGGVGVDQAWPAGLWVPGNDAPLVPPGTGVGYYLPPGWEFVVQVHYNYSAGKKPDRSSVVAWRADSVITEVPHALAVGNIGFQIPPGASNFTVTGTGSITSMGNDVPLQSTHPGRIYAVWGHEHLLGKSVQLDLVHADGTSQCLLHIPNWQFSWQSIYRLSDSHFVDAKEGDTVKVTCSWSNPSTHMVSYGEGTADEMCFASIALLDPR
jgi:hypothetical protein